MSELDDVVSRLEQIILDREVERLLRTEDRVQVARLIVLVTRLLEGQGRLEDTTHFVAEDLAASILRADEADMNTPGMGADAALRSAGDTAAQAAEHLKSL